MFAISKFVLFCAIVQTIVCNQGLEKLTSCSCYLPNGTSVDLSPLAGSGGKPKFEDKPDQSGYSDYVYSYNPCKPFTQTADGEEGTYCKDVAVCQHSQQSTGVQIYYFNLGTQDSVSYSLNSSASIGALLGGLNIFNHEAAQRLQDGDEHVIFTYKDDVQNPARIGLVILTCSQSSAFIAVGELPSTSPSQYVFELADPAACPVAYSGGLSWGTILCIILLVCLIIYVIGGILLLKFVKQSSGSDLIPNKSFWVAMPGLVKDGVQFTYATVTRKPGNYEQV